MSTAKSYFVCCLLLLLTAIVLFLVGGYDPHQEAIQIRDRYYFSVTSTLLLCATILPMLVAFAVACGGLGCIQAWIAFPELLKRSLAYLFTAGILLTGAGAYVRGSGAGDDYYLVFDEARWVVYWGFIFLTLPVLLHLYGFGRRAFRKNEGKRVLRPSEIAGVTNMKAAKLYGLGGLLLIFWVLMRGFWPGWPWEEEWAIGLSGVMAGLFTWPLGAALGAAALFLSVLQSQVAIHERIKVAGAIAYFVGAVIFLGFLYIDLLRDRPFTIPISWTTGAGLALLLVVLLLNLVGILRNRELPASEAALRVD